MGLAAQCGLGIQFLSARARWQRGKPGRCSGGYWARRWSRHSDWCRWTCGGRPPAVRVAAAWVSGSPWPKHTIVTSRSASRRSEATAWVRFMLNTPQMALPCGLPAAAWARSASAIRRGRVSAPLAIGVSGRRFRAQERVGWRRLGPPAATCSPPPWPPDRRRLELSRASRHSSQAGRMRPVTDRDVLAGQ